MTRFTNHGHLMRASVLATVVAAAGFAGAEVRTAKSFFQFQLSNLRSEISLLKLNPVIREQRDGEDRARAGIKIHYGA